MKWKFQRTPILIKVGKERLPPERKRARQFYVNTLRIVFLKTGFFQKVVLMVTYSTSGALSLSDQFIKFEIGKRCSHGAITTIHSMVLLHLLYLLCEEKVSVGQ